MRSLPQHEVAYFLKGCSTLHHIDVAYFLKECSPPHHVDVACCFLINKMTRPLSLSFGIQLFTPILTKAEKWEIEKKFNIEDLLNGIRLRI